MGIPQSDVVVPLASVPDGTGLVVRAHDRLRVAIFRIGDAVYAIDDRCPHQGASLGEGALTGTVVACPWHGFLVDVTTGRCPNHALRHVRSFPVEREGDMIRVIIPPRAPRPDEGGGSDLTTGR
jgi:nitrite reductase/ring-hydroxylating ferredoxin subunit